MQSLSFIQLSLNNEGIVVCFVCLKMLWYHFEFFMVSITLEVSGSNPSPGTIQENVGN